jgi:hypothetical protein
MDAADRYPAGLRTILRSTAVAYGYTLTIATTLAGLTTTRGAPTTGELFLFVGGGLAAFSIIELLLHPGRAGGRDEPRQNVPFAGALNFISVPAGHGGATGVTRALGSPLAWLLSPLAATAVYLLLAAAQLAMTQAWRR